MPPALEFAGSKVFGGNSAGVAVLIFVNLTEKPSKSALAIGQDEVNSAS